MCVCVYGCVCVGISSSVCAEPWLIPADDPLVLVTSFERSLSITGTKRIVDQLTEGAALYWCFGLLLRYCLGFLFLDKFHQFGYLLAKHHVDFLQVALTKRLELREICILEHLL